MSDPFVVVGGDAAGLSAASKLRREDPSREVVVFEKGTWVSYAHCGMPYYVKGEVETLEDLLSLRPAEIEDRGIDLRRQHEVVSVNPSRETVTVETGSETFDQPYDDLLVATGAHAVSSPIEGSELAAVFTMHDMDHAAALRAYLTPPNEPADRSLEADFVDAELVDRYASREPPDSAAIVGGGYVGVEMAEAFAAHDLDVHLFQRSETLLPPFGEPVAARVADTLEEAGMTLHLGTGVDRVAGTDAAEAVVADGTRVPAELVLIGIGIEPNTSLIESTSVERGETGAIATDRFGETSVEGVFAAGDCAETRHTVTGEPSWVPLGLTANRAGRAVGSTVAGEPTPVGDVAGTAVLKAFEQECGRSGILDHDRAQEAGVDPASETVTTSSRSGYYPGAAETTVTLTADRDSGRLLGGSIVGPDRAAVRIDTVATALESDLTVAELERLDLAYAPPFSPVWDPILVAAKVLGGTLPTEESTTAR